MSIAITSAGAGTGKTYHLCSIVTEALTTEDPAKKCRPGAFIATTFTIKAAAELRERIRSRLLADGHHDEAMRVGEALIGTVHSVCARILERFSFEAGISPRLRVIDESLEKILLSQSIEQCASIEEIGEMERLCRRLGQTHVQTFESVWREQVRAVIAAARANNIDPEKLSEMANQSIQEMFAILPFPSNQCSESLLLSTLENTISAIAGNGDATKTTANCICVLEQALADLRTGNLKWSAWCKLSNISAARASQPALDAIQRVARQYEHHPQLRVDIERYIYRIFGFASAAITSYQKRKLARGALDYTDLEALSLDLLGRDEVQACIREEFDLMVVDEFQDTSPIQLALFIQLAKLVPNSQWVGDTKQAIYGFRGCDPTLMQKAAGKFEKGEPLSESRRHRPQLVDFFNSLFPDVFQATHDAMPASEVQLKAYREEQNGMPPATELWSLSSGRSTQSGVPASIKSAEVDACIVQGVLALKNSGMQVSDRDAQKDKQEVLRPVRWGDIAILCYTNKKASAIAAKLIVAGIPTARETKGLLATPEAVLTLACLRWLNDPADSVATAEILSLEACRVIEDWLEDRLDWQATRVGQWGLDGKLKSNVLERIRSLKDRMLLLTPAELLDAVLVRGDVAGLVSQWSAEYAAYRRSNLEALRGLAKEYEAGCLSATSAASHAGFLLWCAALASAEDDTSAFDKTADAVQVMTWHGSKGLEWPIVICLDLEKEPRSRIWNSPVVVPAAEFDPARPLSDRRIRFWPYPFGTRTKEVNLITNAEASEIGKAALREAAAEQTRLQYVVMTRARDLLVFPQDGKKLPWLPEKLECPIFRSSFPASSEDAVDGIRRKLRSIEPGEIFPSISPAVNVKWFAEPKAPVSFPPANLTPSKLSPSETVVNGEMISYGQRIAFGAGSSDAAIGNAIHAVLATGFLNPDGLESRTEDILRAHRVKADASAVAAAALAFSAWVQKHFQPVETLLEVPFTHRNSLGQRVAGNMDLVLILENGEAVLIDHKSYQGADLKTHAATHTGQIAAYCDALVAHGYPVHSAYIHFCTQGKLIKIL